MLDAVFVVASVVCFAVGIAYVHACDRLKVRPSGD